MDLDYVVEKNDKREAGEAVMQVAGPHPLEPSKLYTQLHHVTLNNIGHSIALSIGKMIPSLIEMLSPFIGD